MVKILLLGRKKFAKIRPPGGKKLGQNPNPMEIFLDFYYSNSNSLTEGRPTNLEECFLCGWNEFLCEKVQSGHCLQADLGTTL